MIDNIPEQERAPRLHAARLPTSEIDGFLHALDACDAGVAPAAPLDEEAASLRAACGRARTLLAEMPPRSQRDAGQKRAGETLVHLSAAATRDFFRRHAVPLYADITAGGTRSLRVDDLLWEAAARLPGILPSEAELEEERRSMQQDKDGLEITQGLFVSQVMSDRACGAGCSAPASISPASTRANRAISRSCIGTSGCIAGMAKQAESERRRWRAVVEASGASAQ
jgi:(3,5-dihydroxyphenyl)acetyl-CoA 1,2-dioxygenase